MTYYGGAASRTDRAKAITAVAAVHALLALVILTGLNVRMIQQTVERMQTFDIVQPPPPPPEPPPPPRAKPQKARLEEGAAGKKAEPSPIVAPKPRIPVQSPIAAAPIAGTGSATTAGAANSGTGTGAGGSGMGRGGGYGGFTPAQKITKIPDREYRRLAYASGMERGTVGVAIKVNPDGSASNCRVVRSSGNPVADTLMCQMTEQYIRFRPARDSDGRAVAQDVTWYPNWWRP
jgi:protein TonB